LRAAVHPGDEEVRAPVHAGGFFLANLCKSRIVPHEAADTIRSGRAMMGRMAAYDADLLPSGRFLAPAIKTAPAQSY
jgi:hypothetical protein